MSVTVRLSKTLDKSAKLTHKQTTKMICVLWSDVIELKQFRHQKRAWMNRPEQSGHCQHRAATTQHWTISHRFLPNQKNYVMEGMRASFCLSLHHSRLGFQTKRLCVCVCVCVCVCFVALGASWGAVYTVQECQDWRCNTKVTDIWMLLHGGVSKRASRKIAVCRHRATGGSHYTECKYRNKQCFVCLFRYNSWSFTNLCKGFFLCWTQNNILKEQTVAGPHWLPL